MEAVEGRMKAADCWMKRTERKSKRYHWINLLFATVLLCLALAITFVYRDGYDQKQLYGLLAPLCFQCALLFSSREVGAYALAICFGSIVGTVWSSYILLNVT